MAADNKTMFKRYINGRKSRGEYYMTMEKFKAQQAFYQQASDAGKQDHIREALNMVDHIVGLNNMLDKK